MLLSEEKIMEVVREASRGSATRRDGSTSVRIARAIEAAVLAEQAKQEPVAWDVFVKHGRLFFSVGVQSFMLAYEPEDEPDMSAGQQCEWMMSQLRHALSSITHGVKTEPAPAPEGMTKRCEWHHCGDEYMPGTWDGSCGAKWTFTEDGPVENNMRFCPECGGEVVIATAEKEAGK